MPQLVKIDDAALQQVGGIDEAEGRARVFGLYADTWARGLMVLVICGIFGWLNYKVIAFAELAFRHDIGMVWSGKYTATDRLVTPQVIMSLVGATVVQVGIAIIAIVSYLFPKPPSTAQT